MSGVNRREFVGMAAAAGGLAAVKPAPKASPVKLAVDFSVDGIPISTREYAELLGKLAGGNDITADQYSLGGAVEALEKQFASLLKKEVAVFMPSGTLANHLAVRALCGTKRRAIVQEISHIYNDSGDGAQQLSQLTLIPLAAGKFGGNLWGAWPFAAVASHYAGGYVDRLTAAVRVTEDLWKLLGRDERFSIERVANGTNVLRVTPRVADLAAYRERLAARGVSLPPPEGGGFWMKVNETARGASPEAIAEAFRSALT